MARNKGTFNFAANFQVKMQEALDPRLVVSAKSDLINKETWPYDGDTLYLYEGMTVGVVGEQAVYMLVDIDKALSSDYTGWLRVDAGNAEQVEVVDNLESESSTSALSAKQGKVLLNKITTVEGKITSIYRVKGSKPTYSELPTDAETGDVWNVEAAFDNHPAGTNYVWNGTVWDALGGSIDLSNYLDKDEVAAAIKVETDRATAEEERLAGLIATNGTTATQAKELAEQNQTTLEQVSKNIGDINLILNGNNNPDDEIEDQVGVLDRLTTVEEKNTAQDTRLSALEKLVSGGEAGEGGETLLEMVNTNTTNIVALQKIVSGEDGQSGLEKAVKDNKDAIDILNGNNIVENSVDYKIEKALEWYEVE